jgi:phage-related holin
MDWVKSIIIASIAILAPIHALLIVTSVLIAADTITGILAAYHRKEKITSRSFGRIIVKLLLYNLFIIASFLVEKYILLETVQFTRIAVAIIALTELYSVLENVESATGISFLKIKNVLNAARDLQSPTHKNFDTENNQEKK